MEAMQRLFDAIGLAFQVAIILKADAGARADMIQRTIRVATELHRLRNYNGLMVRWSARGALVCTRRLGLHAAAGCVSVFIH